MHDGYVDAQFVEQDSFVIDTQNGTDTLVVYDANSDGEGARYAFSNTSASGVVLKGYRPDQLTAVNNNIYLKTS